MENPAIIDVGLHWVAVILYTFAALTNTYGLIFKKPRYEHISYWLIGAGLLAHSIALAYRWWLSGHGPYITRYEIMSSNGWIALVVFLIFAKFFSRIRSASILVFPGVFLLLAVGIFNNPEISRLPPTLSGIWLVLHISFYKISLATCIVALAFSLLYIVKNRADIEWLRRLPSLQAMDTYAFRFAGFGFTFWAVGLLAGSIWGYKSWGRFWGWDPVENWSLFTWGLFGVYLHLRRFFGWQGERAAYLYIVCFGMAVFSLFLTPVLSSSIHSVYFQ